jgi:hypothetical protein
MPSGRQLGTRRGRHAIKHPPGWLTTICTWDQRRTPSSEMVRSRSLSFWGDRQFESVSLHRRVQCEPDRRRGPLGRERTLLRQVRENHGDGNSNPRSLSDAARKINLNRARATPGRSGHGLEQRLCFLSLILVLRRRIGAGRHCCRPRQNGRQVPQRQAQFTSMFWHWALRLLRILPTTKTVGQALSSQNVSNRTTS